VKATIELDESASPLPRKNVFHAANQKIRAEYLKTSYARSFCADRSEDHKIASIMKNTLNSGFYKGQPQQQDSVTVESEVSESLAESTERPWARIANECA